jgi:hypothetical protein
MWLMDPVVTFATNEPVIHICIYNVILFILRDDRSLIPPIDHVVASETLTSQPNIDGPSQSILLTVLK